MEEVEKLDTSLYMNYRRHTHCAFMHQAVFFLPLGVGRNSDHRSSCRKGGGGGYREFWMRESLEKSCQACITANVTHPHKNARRGTSAGLRNAISVFLSVASVPSVAAVPVLRSGRTSVHHRSTKYGKPGEPLATFSRASARRHESVREDG